MQRRVVLFAAVAALLSAAAARGTPPVVNYQGLVVDNNGDGYSGTNYLKFVILDGLDHGWWSNDGTPGTNEPASSLTIDLDHGVFHVPLGAVWMGMPAIPTPAFQQGGGFWVRTWFSPSNSNFEALSPDVWVQPESFATIDTASLLVVGATDEADFKDVQAAIDMVATNSYYQGVLVLPGTYDLSAPLTFPSNSWVSVRGASRAEVRLVNTNGAAVVVGDGYLQDLGIRGNPAMTAAGSHADAQLELLDCDLRRESGTGPAVDLAAGSGLRVYAERTRFYGSSGGHVVDLGASTYLMLRQCLLEGADSGAVGLTVTGAGFCDFDGSRIECGEGTAVGLYGTTYPLGFTSFHFLGNIVLSNLASSVAFQGGTVWAHTAPALLDVTIGTGWQRVLVRDAELMGNNGPAVRVSGLSGVGGGAEFRNCAISSSGSVSGQHAVVVTNAPGNSAEDLQLKLTDCTVGIHGTGALDALWASNSEIEGHGISVEGQRYGVRAEGGAQVTLEHSRIEGNTAGGFATGSDSQLELNFTSANAGGNGAGGAGIVVEDGAMAVLFHAQLTGDGGDSAAVGLALTGSGAAPAAYVMNSALFGGYRALRASVGSVRALQSSLITFGSSAVELVNTATAPQAELDGCSLMRVQPGTDAPVLLVGDGSHPAPTPKIARSTIDAAGADRCFALSGVSTATVYMANSVLSTNVGAGVAIPAASVTLPAGNIIP